MSLAHLHFTFSHFSLSLLHRCSSHHHLAAARFVAAALHRPAAARHYGPRRLCASVSRSAMPPTSHHHGPSHDHKTSHHHGHHHGHHHTHHHGAHSFEDHEAAQRRGLCICLLSMVGYLLACVVKLLCAILCLCCRRRKDEDEGGGLSTPFAGGGAAPVIVIASGQQPVPVGTAYYPQPSAPPSNDKQMAVANLNALLARGDISPSSYAASLAALG